MAVMLIYSPQDSARLQYVLREIFVSRFGIAFQVCSDRHAFLAHTGPRLSYAPEKLQHEEIWIPSTSFLFEKGTGSPVPKVGQAGETPVLFPLHEEFDLFSMFFFLVSRYEEYASEERDAHDRFPARASLAHRNGFLEIPVLDIWLARLADKLNAVFPDLLISRPSFTFLPTYDIDQAWAFLHKPLKRQVGGLALDLLNGRIRKIRQRLAVWFRLQADPFDTFAFIFKQHKPLFFFLIADPGPFDKNTPYQKKAFQALVKDISRKTQVGLHPSYQSTKDPGRLTAEKERLEKLSGMPVYQSRQHFLRLQIPHTYRQLLAAGIREDHTMGYADAIGFRAGTSLPFHWYDLEREMATDLRIVPFQIMDVTLRQYMKIPTEEALDRIRPLIRQIAEAGGQLTTLWHNSSFDEKGEWKGWTQVYIHLLEEISYLYQKVTHKNGT